MTDSTVKAVVTKADVDVVRVKVFEDEMSKELEDLGFVYDHTLNEYVFHVFDDNEKAAIFNLLRSRNVGFSSGKEWCPSEVFEYLRDQGLLSDPFQEVAWVSPGKVRVTTI